MSENNLNKPDHFNRGIEVLLAGGRVKKPKPFHIIFEKIIYFLNQEVGIYFEFSFYSKKNTSLPEKKNASN